MGIKPKRQVREIAPVFYMTAPVSFLVSERVYAPSFQVKYLILL